MIEFLMPSLGADMEDGTLVEWKKKPGDPVKRGDIIAEVETQKGLIEIEVFEEGTIAGLLITEGAKVPVGTVMAMIAPLDTAKETKKEKVTDLQPTEEKAIARREYKASPLARKIAFDNKMDLSLIEGTGPDGAITKEDVEKAIAQTSKTAEQKIAEKPMEGIRSAIAAAMSKSNLEIPHYYLEKRIDMTKALAWLHETNSKLPIKERLLPVALMIKAVAKSLIEFPNLNSSWENGLQPKKDINIGFVVSLRNGGILVPAIHQANTKNVSQIMETLNDIIPRARAMKLRSSELTESTITVTNIGDGGAEVVLGVIYPPQVAIIGFGSSSEQPFAENGMLGIRTVLTVTLSGDHRATDGLLGSRFLGSLNNHLQNPDLL